MKPKIIKEYFPDRESILSSVPVMFKESPSVTIPSFDNSELKSNIIVIYLNIIIHNHRCFILFSGQNKKVQK